jgi:2-methylcitrate dehydratase PrpD
MSAGVAAEAIAEFVTEGHDAVPDDAASAVARAFLDTIAVAIAAKDEPISRILQDMATGRSGTPSASIWLTGELVAAETAALVNGTMAHALDFDDVAVCLRGHPSVVLFPTLVALAEGSGAKCEDLARAYVLGFEVLCKLAKSMAQTHYRKGWQSSATLGAIASTAAGASLLGLTYEETVNAIGLSAGLAAGIRESFGTMAKAFQVGQSSATAVQSVHLARRGLTAAKTALDGRYGFLALFGDGENVWPELTQLGVAPMELEASGVTVKKYPLCYATHAALDIISDLRDTHDLRLAEVTGVVVTTRPAALAPLIHARPQTGLEGKFSMEYAMASSLADGQVTLASFTDAAVQRPEIQAFLPRVTAVECSAALVGPELVTVDVQTVGGEVIHGGTDGVRGGPGAPLSDQELIAKIESCLSFARFPVSARQLAAAVSDWHDRVVPDLLPTAVAAKAHEDRVEAAGDRVV